jgi:hypothetical protein
MSALQSENVTSKQVERQIKAELDFLKEQNRGILKQNEEYLLHIQKLL